MKINDKLHECKFDITKYKELQSQQDNHEIDVDNTRKELESMIFSVKKRFKIKLNQFTTGLKK